MPPLFHKHPRLRRHDYTKGTYFVTFSTERRGEILGRIAGTGAEARMEFNDVGSIVEQCWNAIPEHHPNVRITAVQFMPDHVHAIVVLGENVDARGGSSGSAGETNVGVPSKSTQLSFAKASARDWVDGTSTREAIPDGGGEVQANTGRPKGPKRGSLGAIMAVFKSESTKRINVRRMADPPGRQFWKKGYNERVIREHNGEYGRIAQYIAENPKKWK